MRVHAVDSESLHNFMSSLQESVAKLDQLMSMYDCIDNNSGGSGRLATVVQNSVQLASCIKSNTHVALASLGKWLDRCRSAMLRYARIPCRP